MLNLQTSVSKFCRARCRIPLDKHRSKYHYSQFIYFIIHSKKIYSELQLLFYPKRMFLFLRNKPDILQHIQNLISLVLFIWSVYEIFFFFNTLNILWSSIAIRINF